MRIYLADLGHNQVTVSSDTYPLGVANLATYAQAYAKTRTPLEVRIFREPQDLKVALDAAVPDVLLSGNHAAIARWRLEQRKVRTKERRPDLWAAYEERERNRS